MEKNQKGVREIKNLWLGNSPRTWKCVVFFTACLLACFYTLWTNHIWEDYFITFRHSQNLAEGKGLLYNTGERVHGFTSPIGVLLPALFYTITGKTSYLPALWIFRILSILLYAGSAVLMLEIVRKNEGKLLALVLVSVFYLLDVKSIAFSTNGQETAFMLFFLSASILVITDKGLKNWFLGGLIWTGLMWTRPDSFLYIAAVSLASLLFYPNRKERLSFLFKMASVCFVFYLPWFLGAWFYYGSPIPHTVLAKGLSHSPVNLLEIFSLVFERAEMAFIPIYSISGGWPDWVYFLAKLQGFFCLFYWMIPNSDRLGRASSFCFGLLSIYLASMSVAYPWYLPPVSLFGWLTLSLGISCFYRSIKQRMGEASYIPVTGIFVLIVTLSIYIEVNTFRLMRAQQAEIELGNRQKIGIFLKENVKETETVYMECIGYIGYFSGVKILDWPGLTSPTIVRIRKEKKVDLAGMIPEVQPDWLVLRPSEVEAASKYPFFLTNYEEVKHFDVRKSLKKYRGMTGNGYMTFDAVFSVFKKRTPEKATALGE